MTDSIQQALAAAGLEAEVREMPDGACEVSLALEGDAHALAARVEAALSGVATMAWPFYTAGARFVAFARPVAQ